jgi:tetratricopeptide (TPR) repeat protein
MNKEVWLEQGRVLEEAGRYREALSHYEAAIDLDNNWAEAWYGRAGALSHLAQYEPAVEAFERARKLDPVGYSSIGLYGIGNCYVGLGDRRRAIGCYDQALQERPQLKRVWHNRGTALFELGRYEEAAGSYARVLEIEPSEVRSRIWMERCLERLGRSEGASQQSGEPQEFARAWMEVATHEFKASDIQHALTAYQRAAAAQPSLGYAWVGQGTCLASLGRWQEALQALDHAVSLADDSRSLALAYRGSVLKAMGRQDESERTYQRLLHSAPASVEDHGARVSGLYASEHYEEALAGLGVLKRLDPQNSDAWYVEGLSLDALGRFAEAAESFGEFLQRQPENGHAWFYRARALTAIGKADQAVDCCEKAITLGFATAESWLQKGITLAQLERYRDAIPCMDKALEQAQGWDDALYNRGVCHYHLGDHDTAMHDFDCVLEQGTPSIYSIIALDFKEQSLTALGQIAAAESCGITAEAYTALADDRFDDAVQFFREALRRDAKNAAASLRLAAMLVDGDDPGEAAEQLAQALALRPQNVDLWSTRGVVLSRLGKKEEALECYTRALELDSLYLPALRNSANGLVAMGRLQEALERYERALALEDQNANGWYGRGVCLARLDRSEEAVQAFRRAVELAPNDAEAWKDLGTCLVKVNKHREALEAWQTAARLNPGIDLKKQIDQLTSVTDNSGQVHYLALTAHHYLQQRRFEDAAGCFDAALELDSQQYVLWSDRGICAEQIEGPERAIEYFDRALALDPEQEQTWYNKAVSLQHLDRFRDAIAAFEKTLTLHRSKDLPADENLLHGHHNLASCLILTGKAEEALDHCDEVLLLARENPERWQEEARRAQLLKKAILDHSSGC